MPRLAVSQVIPSPVNSPLITVGSSEPGTVTSTPAQAMAVETIPVTANRIRNSMNGSGSLLPSRSTPSRIRSVSPRVPGCVDAVLTRVSCGAGTEIGRGGGRRAGRSGGGGEGGWGRAGSRPAVAAVEGGGHVAGSARCGELRGDGFGEPHIVLHVQHGGGQAIGAVGRGRSGQLGDRGGGELAGVQGDLV